MLACIYIVFVSPQLDACSSNWSNLVTHLKATARADQLFNYGHISFTVTNFCVVFLNKYSECHHRRLSSTFVQIKIICKLYKKYKFCLRWRRVSMFDRSARKAEKQNHPQNKNSLLDARYVCCCCRRRRRCCCCCCWRCCCKQATNIQNQVESGSNRKGAAKAHTDCHLGQYNNLATVTV